MASTNPINDYIAGAVGGMAGLFIGHPFDTTKVRGFFRGMGFPLVSYGVVNSVFFGVYGNVLKLLQSKEKDGVKVVSYGQIYIAGCAAGAAQLLVACPVEVVKVVLQSQVPSGTGRSTMAVDAGRQYFRGPMQCLSWLYQTQGLRGVYRGMAIMALRDVPSFGVYTLVYEGLYVMLSRTGVLDRQGILASLISGGCAGCACWGLIIPIDVMKSMVQADTTHTQYSGLRDCARKLYRKTGVWGFFTGIQVTLFRAFLVNSVTFLFYSKSLNMLNLYN